MTNNRLKPGDLAPDWKVLDPEGQPVSLADAWQGGSALLVFLRHFG